MNKSSPLPILIAALLMFGAACSNKQEPAAQVISNAETSLAAVKEDAGRYVPESLAGAEAKLAALKDRFAAKDYDGVIAGGPDLTGSITQLESEVVEKRQLAATEAEAWTGLATDVPQMTAAIQSRVDTLGKARRLPKGMEAATLESAREGLAQMKTDWALATAAHDEGNPIAAAEAARAAQSRGREVMVLLGMPSG
jgi:hypothetical protein